MRWWWRNQFWRMPQASRSQRWISSSPIPPVLYDDQGSTVQPDHWLCLGRFPVYGAFGYKNETAPGGSPKMHIVSWARSPERTSLPDGTAVKFAQYGPAVSGTYRWFIISEFWIHIPGSGDLDAHNGRFCITPDYPDGIYACFVTLDADGSAAFRRHRNRILWNRSSRKYRSRSDITPSPNPLKHIHPSEQFWWKPKLIWWSIPIRRLIM